jgi:hypothetical protein
MKPQFFLNVDLDVASTEDLTPLLRALEPVAYALERPAGLASFELGDPTPTQPEPLILEFVRLISGLPAEARGIWERATKRTFDIGMQSSHEPAQASYRLSAETLRAAADIGAEIAITVYALDPDEAN